MHKKSQLLPVLAIFFTILIWGLSYISTKVLLDYLAPMDIAFFRFVLASLAMLLIALFKKPQKLARQDTFRLIAGGAIGIPVYFIMENNGLKLTTAGMASMIIAIIPVLNVLTGVLFFKEKNTWRNWAGVALSFLGVYLIVSYGIGSSCGVAGGTLGGNLLILMAAVSWTVFTRVNAPLLKKYNSFTVNFYQILAGTLFLGFLTLPGGVNLEVFVPVVIANLLYLGILSSALAYFLYLFALKSLGTTTVTTFINLIPVFGVLGGVFILGEVVFPGQILGGLVVILGVIMVTVSVGAPGKRLRGEKVKRLRG